MILIHAGQLMKKLIDRHIPYQAGVNSIILEMVESQNPTAEDAKNAMEVISKFCENNRDFWDCDNCPLFYDCDNYFSEYPAEWDISEVHDGQ